MPRSRSRSRGDDRPPLGGLAGLAAGRALAGLAAGREEKQGGNSESDIVNVAIKQLTPKIRDRLMKLFDEGLLKDNDLDLRSITVFASLNEGLQDRVMTHMENERIYVANARSKSGFLIATCDKAKTGCLDARGLGAIDPWRSALVAMATPKQKILELLPEKDWLDKNPDTVKFEVNVGVAENEVGMPKVTVEVPLSETAAAIKGKLSVLGIKSIPENQMKLHAEGVGFVKDGCTLAYYNLKDGAQFELSVRKRGGSRFRADHALPLKRPRTQDWQLESKPEAEAPAPAATLPGLPAMPSLPGLPGLPSLPGLAKLGGLPALQLPGGGAALPGLPGLLPGLPQSPALGTMPGLLAGLAKPGLPGLAAAKLPGMPGLPGLAPPGLDPAFLAKLGALPGLGLPGMPKLGLGLPGGSLLGGSAKAPGVGLLPGMSAKAAAS